LKRILDNLKFTLPISLVIAFVRVNRRGVGDLDSWWQVKIGDQIRAGVPFNDLGKSWSLYSGHWRTSQWLSEVLMSLSQQAFGWQGLLWWRFIFGVLLLGALVATLARSNEIPAVVLTSVIAACVLVPSIQERPALVGLIFVTFLGTRCSKILLEGRLSRSIWLWVPATALWANLHGSWILAPAALALASLLVFARVRSRSFAIESGLLVLSVAGAGCLTPIGWHGLVLPFKLQATAGKFITEWQPTTLVDPLIYGLLVLLALLIYIWTRGRERPSGIELLWILFWALFAFTAFRNVGPATLFIAPIAAHRIDQWCKTSEIFESSSKEHILSTPFKISVGLALAVVAVSTALVAPLKAVSPQFIAERLSSATTDVRIINDYNASGVLLGLGGERIHLAVDGRADRFDPNWLSRYFSMLKEANSNYYLIDELKPNAAVLNAGSPLIWWLVENRNWKRIMNDGQYVLVTAPNLKLSP
jgi:hypothetical protein